MLQSQNNHRELIKREYVLTHFKIVTGIIGVSLCTLGISVLYNEDHLTHKLINAGGLFGSIICASYSLWEVNKLKSTTGKLKMYNALADERLRFEAVTEQENYLKALQPKTDGQTIEKLKLFAQHQDERISSLQSNLLALTKELESIRENSSPQLYTSTPESSVLPSLPVPTEIIQETSNLGQRIDPSSETTTTAIAFSRERKEGTGFDWSLLADNQKYPHVAIEGPSRQGKSVLAEYIISLVGSAITIVATPDYQHGVFPNADVIVGICGNCGGDIKEEPHIPFADIVEGKTEVSCSGLIKSLYHEWQERLHSQEFLEGKELPKICVVLDEYNRYAARTKCGSLLGDLLCGAAKTNIQVFLIVHVTQMKDMGMEGRSSLMHNLVRIRFADIALDTLIKPMLNKTKSNPELNEHWQKAYEVITLATEKKIRACMVRHEIGYIPNLTEFIKEQKPGQKIPGLPSHKSSQAHHITSQNKESVTSVTHPSQPLAHMDCDELSQESQRQQRSPFLEKGKKVLALTGVY